MTASGENIDTPRVDHTSSAETRQVSGGAHRHDLDGLRAIAIGLVVIYHIWIGRVSGGVDVFLMLSAFFLTGSLVRRGERGPLKLASYYAHRFWRLVPPAAAVILATIVAAYFLFPQSLWPTVWSQSVASLLYFENWHLAFTATDYYARDTASLTPFLHFWSLSIQGQVFVLWPLLLALCWAVSRIVRARLRTVAFIVFAVVFASSLTYSIISTANDQAFAYFDTGARLWEFAFGSLLALLPTFRTPRWIGAIITAIALVALVACGMVLDVEGGFPGYLALWPTAAAGLIIAFGSNDNPVGRVIGSGPVRAFAKISYALYLVHWPVLITWTVLSGEERPDFLVGSGLIVIAVAIAILVYAIVERPSQRWTFIRRSSIRTFVAIGVCVVAVASLTVGWQVRTQALDAERLANASANDTHPGARIVDDPNDSGYRPEPTLPSGATLDAEWVHLSEACTDSRTPSEDLDELKCQQEGNGTRKTIAFIGDSHMEQFMGAFLPFLDKSEYTPVSLLLGGCTFSPDSTFWDTDAFRDGECATWNRQAKAYVEQTTPDVLVMMGTRVSVDSNEEESVDEVLKTARWAVSRGIQVVLVRDNPRFGENKFVCSEQHQADLTACDRPLSESLAAENPNADLAKERGIHLLDLTRYICPDGVCSAVVGNIAVYLDDNHLTWMYARSMAPMAQRMLVESGLRF